MSAPYDPFQGARPALRDPFLELARLWSKYLAEKEGPNRPTFVDYAEDDEYDDRLFKLMCKIEDAVAASSHVSLAGVALKLRILARSLNIQEASCANHDGVRTNALTGDEIMLASALADVERLIGDAA